MSIPLDRFYLHLESILKQISNNIIIYRFFPHGSKKLEDLKPLRDSVGNMTWLEGQKTSGIICHDQEPLHYDLYTNEILLNFVKNADNFSIQHPYLINKVAKLHLRATMFAPLNCYNQVLLLHSEKNSTELKKYQENNFIGVYWWSHAVIARDWFRYAEHISQSKQSTKTFLIYNRAWAGTREYRLKFAEHLVRLNLNNDCRASVSPIEPELRIHYNTHKFENPIWRPSTVLENFFSQNTSPSHSSADFDLKDYESTDIEVVLETLFDDRRLHLTEKSLRPIALGQPFILAGTPGSLEYLHSYGFKTFGPVWDERYDSIQDPQERLGAISDIMKHIANWSPQVKQRKIAQAQAIADYNKQLFFSAEFHNKIFEELKTNLVAGVAELKQSITGRHFFETREVAKYDAELNKIVNSDLPWRTQEDIKTIMQWIKNPT